jgi:hypothetical protein
VVAAASPVKTAQPVVQGSTGQVAADFTLLGQNVRPGAPLAQPFMTGISPVSPGSTAQEKPSIAAFELEEEPTKQPSPTKSEKRGKKGKKGRR